MKTLYEGILSDIDTAVGSMDKGIDDAMGISTLPTIKDIMFADWSKDVYIAYWKCPHIIQQYKHLPIVNDNITGVRINWRMDKTKVRTSYITHVGVFEIDLVYNDNQNQVLKLWGWELPEQDSKNYKLPAAKKLAIELLHHFAHNPNSLKEMLEYSIKAKDKMKAAGNYNLFWKDVRDLLKIK